jgi:nucleoid-associated protein
VEHFLEDQTIDGLEEDTEQDRNYLSFLSQRANGRASAYFITALGCVVGISSARATDKIFEAVDAFFRENAAIVQYRRAAKERVTEYLHQQLGSDQLATLDGICGVLNRVVRPEHAAHLDTVSEFLNGPKYKIPDEFNVHEKALKKHTKVTLESERLNIKFDRSILGTTLNSEICYDKQNRTLLIRSLSDGFIEKLDSTLLNG